MAPHARSQSGALSSFAAGDFTHWAGNLKQGKRAPPMRTLLRKIPTGEYYQTLSHWTPDPAEAYNFHAVNPAIRFASLARLAETEVVLGSEYGPLTAIPVTKFQSGLKLAAAFAAPG